MGFQVEELLMKFSAVTSGYGVAGIAAIIVVIIPKLTRRHNLDAFPTVGSSSLPGSWWAGFKFLIDGVDVIQEGYKKHKSMPFKVASMYSWMVILSNPKHIEEVQRTPDDQFSFVEAFNDMLCSRYTLGDEVHDTPYHLGVVRSQLTRNIGKMYPEIRDEIVTAFDEVLDLRHYEWKNVSALSVIQKVVCRTSNRLFVGLPLCRNPDWIDLNIQFTVNIVKTGLVLRLLPKFLRPLATYFFPTVARDTLRGLKHLGPIIEERLKHSNECRDEWAERPNDLLSWLMEEAEGLQLRAEELTTRVLAVNFTAIHTTSNSFTQALFFLAANPQYIQPLREEVEAIVEKEGWSQTALRKMRKVDSFIRECQRMEGLGALTVAHKAMKDFTFSDGTFIPKGTMTGVPIRCLHHDEKLYKNANVFQPFRFFEMHEEDSGGLKYQFTSTAVDYLPFGHGKHACPGRFFAANEMKTMLAHIVTTYDIKLEDGATRPRSLRFGTSIMPDPHATVLFRRRIDCAIFFVLPSRLWPLTLFHALDYLFVGDLKGMGDSNDVLGFPSPS